MNDCESSAAARFDSPEIDEKELCRRVIESDVALREERLTAAMTYKSAEFSAEDEARLVLFGLPQKFRPARDDNFVVPYSELELPNDRIDVRIVTGPNREPQLANRTIGSLVRAAKDSGTAWNICHHFAGEYSFRS